MSEILSQFNADMTALGDSIRAKSGVTGKMTVPKMKQAVDSIEQGADVSIVTATAADVREGKIIVNADGEPVEGTIKNVSEIVPDITIGDDGLITATARQPEEGYVTQHETEAYYQLETSPLHDNIIMPLNCDPLIIEGGTYFAHRVSFDTLGGVYTLENSIGGICNITIRNYTMDSSYGYTPVPISCIILTRNITQVEYDAGNYLSDELRRVSNSILADMDTLPAEVFDALSSSEFEYKFDVQMGSIVVVIADYQGEGTYAWDSIGVESLLDNHQGQNVFVGCVQNTSCDIRFDGFREGDISDTKLYTAFIVNSIDGWSTAITFSPDETWESFISSTRNMRFDSNMGAPTQMLEIYGEQVAIAGTDGTRIVGALFWDTIYDGKIYDVMQM